VPWRHLNRWVDFIGDDKIQRAGHRATGDDNRAEFRSFHEAVIAFHAEAAGSRPFAFPVVALQTIGNQNGADIFCIADRFFATGNEYGSDRDDQGSVIKGLHDYTLLIIHMLQDALPTDE